MLSPYNSEQLEILRRIAERGRRIALAGVANATDFVDLFQYILDELNRIDHDN